MRSLYVVVLFALSACNMPDFSYLEGPPTHVNIRESSISIAEGRLRVLSVDVDHCTSIYDCLNWLSSDQCVASGSANVVFGHHFGNAVLHAAAREAPAAHDSVRVTVTAVVPATLRLGYDSVLVPVGFDYALPVRFYDGAAYEIGRVATFRSNDTAVAAVASVPICGGTPLVDITAIRPGRTFVTAQFETLVDTVRVIVQ